MHFFNQFFNSLEKSVLQYYSIILISLERDFALWKKISNILKYSTIVLLKDVTYSTAARITIWYTYYTIDLSYFTVFWRRTAKEMVDFSQIVFSTIYVIYD